MKPVLEVERLLLAESGHWLTVNMQADAYHGGENYEH